MAKEIGYFIDKGDKLPGSGKIISKIDNRTNLEYYLQTGRLPHKNGNCDLCQNEGKKEICDNCTGWEYKFIIITMEEAKARREKEIEASKKKDSKNGK